MKPKVQASAGRFVGIRSPTRRVLCASRGRSWKEEERLCRELGDPNGLAISLANQAGILAQQGQPDQARGLAQEAYQLAMQHGLTALAQQIASIVQQLGGRIE